MVQTKTLANIHGARVIEAEGNFYDCLIALQEAGAKPITPRNEAYARMQTAESARIGKDRGTWTSAGFEYANKQPVLLRAQSHLLNPELARQAVEVNRAGKYFSSKDIKFYEESMKQAEKDASKEPAKRQVLILPSRDNFSIAPKTNFEVLEFLLKDKAKKYFEFNGSNPIEMYLVDKKTVDAQNGTLMTQMWFRSLGGWSELIGDSRYLYNGNRVRGVLRQTGEASSQRVLPYTQRDIRAAEKELGRLAKTLQPQHLTKLKNLVEMLKQGK